MSRTSCPRCAGVLALSLVGIPFCRGCRRRERPEIRALIAGGEAAAARTHTRLVEIADALEGGLQP